MSNTWYTHTGTQPTDDDISRAEAGNKLTDRLQDTTMHIDKIYLPNISGPTLISPISIFACSILKTLQLYNRGDRCQNYLTREICRLNQPILRINVTIIGLDGSFDPFELCWFGNAVCTPYQKKINLNHAIRQINQCRVAACREILVGT